MGAKRLGRDPMAPYWAKLPNGEWGVAVRGGALPGQAVTVTNSQNSRTTSLWIKAISCKSRNGWVLCTFWRHEPSQPAKAGGTAPPRAASAVATAMGKPSAMKRPRRRACEDCGIYCPPPGATVCRVCLGDA